MGQGFSVAGGAPPGADSDRRPARGSISFSNRCRMLARSNSLPSSDAATGIVSAQLAALPMTCSGDLGPTGMAERAPLSGPPAESPHTSATNRAWRPMTSRRDQNRDEATRWKLVKDPTGGTGTPRQRAGPNGASAPSRSARRDPASQRSRIAARSRHGGVPGRPYRSWIRPSTNRLTTCSTLTLKERSHTRRVSKASWPWRLNR